MLKIKKLYIYLVQAFIPVFFMTFGICLFILLMQFLWRYIEDLVGKGIDSAVLLELFTYAGLQLIPMALPLGVLLASLMTFGSKGENLELLAIKASGISLPKAMKPLLILVVLITVGSFVFQNEGMPVLNVKMRTLLISIKRKSPELDIPEGSFYSGINSYSLFVKRKDRETKMLHDVMIYDTSEGFDNMAVFVCDSAHMKVSQSKDFLILDLYSGQRFANFRQGTLNSTRDTKFVPYGRENFKKKQIVISFNSDFNRLDESIMDGTQLSKNIKQLTHSIDSMSNDLDSMNIQDRITATNQVRTIYAEDTLQKEEKIKLDFDSVINSYNHNDITRYMNSAIGDTDNAMNNYMYRPESKGDLQKNIRYHQMERHKKFTQAIACLIFFLIGAPLGAIVRKGGLGMPTVISVCLFIVYYIFETTGTKMARDGVWEIWQGVWFSTFMLLPLALFLTYKAMNDSALFNPEAYDKFFRKILFIKNDKKITQQQRSTIINLIPSIQSFNIEPDVLNNLTSADSDVLRELIAKNDDTDDENTIRLIALSILKDREADITDIIEKQDVSSSEKIMHDYSINAIFSSISYILLIVAYNMLPFDPFLIAALVYIAFYIRSFIYYQSFFKKTDEKSDRYHTIVSILSFVAYPIIYPYIRIQMKKALLKAKKTSFFNFKK